ncbi:PLP-dependent aminotransferase family protein [Macrococcus equipercicus]|uniref:PLP-dependent aminotransferase family protein n=1 Tax=Macrococcus equipercicus TaxID=69967 RepID=A0ABQ6R8I0_9STAP|nr:PLP-dependent aminotransferase family protein [Macrococcus equipercicus]KAA1039423.1 PLP-dependent aminotransferase family protein [Macrococcus equipercicus]
MEQLTYPLTGNDFLYQQLYQFIKDDILAGRLTFAEKLPSKRKLSQHLSISQTTVEIAYQQLQDEGFIYSKPKVGYFVEDIKTVNSAPKNSIELHLPSTIDHTLSLTIEDSHQAKFPFQLFRKYARDAFEVESSILLERGDAQGEPALRNEIRRYLYHSRGVHCTNEQIIIGSSTEQLFTLLTRLLPDATYLLENPGYPSIRKVLQYENKPFKTIDVDAEGIIVSEIHNQGNIVHVTPSHQFPTGAVLSAGRRTELLAWAGRNSGHYIIEDDYDSEFRYKGRPLKALQGMDNSHKVIYMSTFSKSIFPSIRMAYLVLPEPLLRRYQQLSNKPNITVPRHMQYIVTQFMQDGEFERNINRMRKIYKRKSELALSALAHYKEAINISGEFAGMHFIVEVKGNEDIRPIIDDMNIKISMLEDYMQCHKDKAFNKFILGFGGLEDAAIEEVITKLMKELV